MSDGTKSLFERDGFTMNVTQEYKGHKIEFQQWAARYVGDLERENEHLKELVQHLRGKLDHERMMYIYKITTDDFGKKKD